ncbi:MAG: DUF5615 family PIN-like protein [Dehalococcoidia bacterium]|nr:DUF5615 family PIN-like protein [Dehalococcoidia bacterium]MCB9486542.1 DUF5615 family PIN-like protein [Thermoflexaceae bacterium]
MTFAFYFDHNVERVIADGLRRMDLDVLAALDDGMGTASDSHLLDRSTELGRLLVTRDRDFVELTARRLRQGPPFSSVVMLRGSQAGFGAVIRDLELLAKAGSDDDGMNPLIYVPFRR